MDTNIATREIKDFKVTVEWLHSFGDDYAEPSGLVVPSEPTELEFRKSRRLVSSDPNTDGAEKSLSRI